MVGETTVDQTHVWNVIQTLVCGEWLLPRIPQPVLSRL